MTSAGVSGAICRESYGQATETFERPPRHQSQTLDPQVVADLTRRRLKVSLAYTAALFIVYFGFILLVAYQKRALAYQIVDGLTLAILFGMLVILISWLLTWRYGAWVASFEQNVQRLLSERGLSK